MGILSAPMASAQDTDGASFSISPRLYYTFIGTGDYSEVTGALLSGLSLTAGPAGGNWDITLNGLDGDGDSDWTDLSERIWGETGFYEINRTDYELLWRYRLQDSPVYIGLGARQVDTEDVYTGDITGWWETGTTEMVFGEFAVGFSAQASEGSRHSMFGNLLVGLGSFDYLVEEYGEVDSEVDGTALLFDANLGYQYVINQTVSFSARYRVIALQLSAYSDSIETVHGPELALTFRF